MYEWEEKDLTNIAKHGVSFEEAKEALEDPNRIEFFDEKHSIFQDRYKCICATQDFIILVVIVTDRIGVTRIISARNAKSYERQR